MEEATPDMMPYFFNLVKDPKRLSLVFATKAALFAYVLELQRESLFGEAFDKEV